MMESSRATMYDRGEIVWSDTVRSSWAGTPSRATKGASFATARAGVRPDATPDGSVAGREEGLVEVDLVDGVDPGHRGGDAVALLGGDVERAVEALALEPAGHHAAAGGRLAVGEGEDGA